MKTLKEIQQEVERRRGLDEGELESYMRLWDRAHSEGKEYVKHFLNCQTETEVMSAVEYFLTYIVALESEIETNTKMGMSRN
jgi:hypothetical protein